MHVSIYLYIHITYVYTWHMYLGFVYAHTAATCRLPTVNYSKNCLQSFLDSQGISKDSGCWLHVSSVQSAKLSNIPTASCLITVLNSSTQPTENRKSPSGIHLTHRTRRSLVLHPRHVALLRAQVSTQHSVPTFLTSSL